MEYPSKFKQLIKRLEQTKDSNLKFVGLGNPASFFLIVGKECAIDRTTTRGQGCYEMEHAHNTMQWVANIEKDIQEYNVPNWLTSPIGEQSYNPLAPYKGQLNKKAYRDADGSITNQGTSATWCAYQKLMDAICKTPKSHVVTFYDNAFLTELSDATSTYSKPKNSETKASIDIRRSQLLNDEFFRSFPVTIVACGHYVRDYDIDLQKTFDQHYIGIVEKPNYWYCLHEKDGRLLIHTRHLSMCPSECIYEIADVIRRHFVKTLLKYCLYYDGTEPNGDNALFADYEQHWVNAYIATSNTENDGDIQEMKHFGVSEEWLNKFDIPYSLIALFFNRYCHWNSPYVTLEGFQNWFEGVRKMSE